MTDPSPSSDDGFGRFSIDPRILEAVAKLGFDTPTPIQAEGMPPALEGRDLIGRARTGSGKTAAFGLPLLHRVRDGGSHVRALVLAPTRELAIQVTEALRSYAKRLPVRILSIYGGAAYGPQLAALRKGVPVVVGTPGRVLDHLERGTLDLSKLELLVLDEADEMLRMGFIEDVERVLAASPSERQVVLFSATMPPEIRSVAEAHLNDPLEVQVESSALSVGHIAQQWLPVPQRFKVDALTRVLAAEPAEATLVFARTRAGCAEVADTLAQRGVEVDALHGDLNQAARERVLSRLRSGRLRVVIATDVAARGIDVEHLTHVINFDLPNDAETYVHRIGRTGRAGRKGVAISFVTPKEQGRIRWLQRTLKVPIDRMVAPSDLAIRDTQKARLAKELVDATEDAGALALLTELESGHDIRAIAASAIAKLARARGLKLDGDPNPNPPRWAQSKERSREPRPDRRTYPSRDEIDLFFPIGAARGVRPGDLVGALANEASIEGTSIGRITILPHKSFVRVERQAAEHILAHHADIEVRGRQVRIAKARKRPAPSLKEEGGRGRPKRRGKSGPPRRPKKRWNKKR
ncbi:MAG: DEAD/DEAH box helicase [Myxococcota bacterium]